MLTYPRQMASGSKQIATKLNLHNAVSKINDLNRDNGIGG